MQMKEVRKIKADSIFDGRKFLFGKILYVNEDGTIIGIDDDKQDAHNTNLEIFHGILVPGFINCHCHLELSHLKNVIEEKTGLVDFLIKVMQLRSFDKEEILSSIKLGDKEMYDEGIVAVGDICNTTDTVLQKRSSHILYRNFVETMGFLPGVAQVRFDYSLKNVFEIIAAENCNTTIVAHAPYSVSKELLQLINRYAAGKIVTIHNQETEEENKFFQEGKSEFLKLYQFLKTDISFYRPTGKNSLPSYLSELDLPSKILLVHNTTTSEEDILFAEKNAKENGQTLFWVLCPNANLYIENRLPQINLLRKCNCNIVLGTDSLASNHQLNILAEIKTIQKYFPEISLEEMLRWATLNGARALGFSDGLGSFEKGKKPGLVLLNKGLEEVKRIF